MGTTLKLHGHDVEIEELRRVTLRPGEIVVVRVDNTWPLAAIKQLQHALEEYVFTDNRVAVIPAENVDVISPTEDSPA